MTSKFPAFIIRKLPTYGSDIERSRMIYKRDSTNPNRYIAVNKHYWAFQFNSSNPLSVYGTPLAIKKLL